MSNERAFHVHDQLWQSPLSTRFSPNWRYWTRRPDALPTLGGQRFSRGVPKYGHRQVRHFPAHAWRAWRSMAVPASLRLSIRRCLRMLRRDGPDPTREPGRRTGSFAVASPPSSFWWRIEDGVGIGRSTADGGRRASDLVHLQYLYATIMYSLFDVGQVRLMRGLGIDVIRMITEGTLIRQLMG